MKTSAISIMALFFTLCLITCGGSGGGGSADDGDIRPSVVSYIQGKAVKGPVFNAEIKLFYFDDTGSEVEIVAVNAPVETDQDGNYDFQVSGTLLMGVTSPLILRTYGGTMNGQPAPTLEGLIADPMPLTFNNVSIYCNLSAVSSVAAGLCRKYAQEIEFAPNLTMAQEIISLVEAELLVDLDADPADPETSLAMFNDFIDQNLDLLNTPTNNPAVDEFIAYLIANLSSSSETLDDTMDDPGDPGTDAPADFAPFGTGVLEGLVPSGPAGVVLMTLASDRNFIENNGTDTAFISVTLIDSQGDPSTALAAVQLGLLSGAGSLTSLDLDYGRGKVIAELTSNTAGENITKAVFNLSNGNAIEQQITVTSVDFLVDSDGDGFSDGEEQMGWMIAIDALGYGSDAVGNMIEKRTVTSNPNLADTDNDGLDDYVEYLIATDPRAIDTDGDGLTDAEEWNQWKSSPTSADTDGDARGPSRNLPPKPELFDGNELFFLFTSPTLNDTDGDGWTDYEEFDHPSRSPRIADLPRLALSVEDDIDVRLDVSYAEAAGQTSQYGAVLTKSNTITASRYHSHTIGQSLKLGSEYSVGINTAGVKYSEEYTFSHDHTVGFSTGSSRTAQSAYSQYNTEARTRTESAATGSMTMGVRLQNTGNLTYTITQLGITARQWLAGAIDPENPDAPGAFSTVATLVPALGSGLTLAPGSTSPVLQLQVSNVNADRVKDLLARPDSLRLEQAYYELENAEGLNFAYLEEITGPRTASVFLDYGDGRVEEYRVAALVNRNNDSTFTGITMGEVMDSILSIPYETRPRQFVNPSAATNENVLYRVRGMATMDGSLNDGFWMVILPDTVSTQFVQDFEDMTIHGGEQIILAYIKDIDGDGLYAPEEQHYRTDDSASADTDGDGLTDVEEVRGGWTVTLPSGSWFTTSDPTQADQDEDGLNDLMEMMAGTDPTLPDTDRDGLGDNYDPHPLHPARVLHVKEGGSPISDGLSWATALGSLAEGLLEAKNGNATPEAEDDVAEIWVATGRYVPVEAVEPIEPEERSISFELSPNISVYGGFAGVETKLAQRSNNPLSFPTFLSGDLLNNDAESYDADPATFADNSLHVLVADEAVEENTVLDGFYLVGGHADNSGLANGVNGAGMLSLGNPTLQNLFFRTNRANQGAGLYVNLTDSQDRQMTITDCLFNRNVTYYIGSAATGGGGAGGGMYYDGEGSTLTMAHVEFRENESWGAAGIYLGENLTAHISKSVFDKNNARNWIVPYYQGGGGGAAIRPGSTVRFNRCRFTQNEGTYGGGLMASDNTSVQINQTVFWENIAWSEQVNNYGGGGAMYIRDADVRIINSTIANNRAIDAANTITGDYGRPGGIYSGTSYQIENSIIYGNTWQGGSYVDPVNIGEQQIMTGGFLTVRTSDIQGINYLGYTGGANINADPTFVDSTIGNLNLSAGSPGIDAGSNYVDYEPLEPGFQLLPETDADGNPRIVDGNGDDDAIVDMGAFEYQGN